MVACGLLCLALIPLPSTAADATIGLYTDESGSLCSFNGDSPGPFAAYVVVRPGSVAVSGVHFAAPIPSCFSATFLGDNTPAGVTAAGSSPTGISLAFASCQTQPVYALQIFYMNNGGTTPCCAFPIVADPALGYLEATDCAYASIPLQASTSYMNANASCACAPIVAPPNPPSNMIPANGAISVAVSPTLSWTCTDPAGLAMTCDLYFGTSSNPPLIASDLPGPGIWNYVPPYLAFETTYYWKVVARNSGGSEAAGPVFSFTTRAPMVQVVAPLNGAVGQSITPTLKWGGPDASAPLTYDVFLGTNPASLPKVAGPLASNQYVSSALIPGTYYWRLRIIDSLGREWWNAMWSFTTNLPPSTPSLGSPADGATNVTGSPILHWDSADPEGQWLSFDLYFGTQSPPPLFSSGLSGLTGGTHQVYAMLESTYYWQIVARDAQGLTATGPIWSFTTHDNTPPDPPHYFYPGDNTTAVMLNVTLAWLGSDPDEQELTYDVYFGTSASPPLVASSITTTNFETPGPQSLLTTYYWRIVARDPLGAEASGTTWSYTTKSADEPPSVPQGSPSHGSTDQPINSILRWDALDPEGQPLNFDLYFGAGNPPPLVADHVTYKTYDPGLLATSTTYRWRVVARDPGGQETSSVLFNFTTSSTSSVPPNPATNPSPALGATISTAMPMLSWQGSDPDGDALQYQVFVTSGDIGWSIGTTNTPYLRVTQPLPPGVIGWWVKAFDGHWYRESPHWWFRINGTATTVTPGSIQGLVLHQNVPNPFNPQTSIRYDLPASSHVRLSIFDSSGRRIRTLVDEDQSAGSREAVWTGRDDSGNAVSSGVYFYVLDAGKQRLTRKLVLLK